MGWFENAFLWPRLLASSEGRDQLKSDIRYGEGAAGVGSPLHGLTAGYKLHELMSPTVHINDRIQDLKKNGTSGHFSRMRDDMHHYAQDAFKENIPALVGWLGGAAAGVGEGGGLLGGAGAGAAEGGASGGVISAGDAAAIDAAGASAAMNGTSGVSAASGMGMNAPAAGINWGSMAGQGAGLLGQAAAQPQQNTAPAVSTPPQRGNAQQQQRAQTLQRMQQLQRKPNKTLEEKQELQELMRMSRSL